ncbi:MAG: site-2 protease family protein [Anaerolineae bacterium]
MLLLSLARNPLAALSLVGVLVVGLTVHEYAHAWTAFRLGDPTASLQGRLSLDPRRHIDPLGALVFLVVGFGWAKPVPIDSYRLGREGTLWVSLAGPASNLALAVVALAPMRLLGPGGLAGTILTIFGFYNLMLAAFNLIPVSPLDGWKVMLGLVRPETAWRLARYEAQGPMILLLLIFASRLGLPDVLGGYLFGVSGTAFRLLTGLHFG